MRNNIHPIQFSLFRIILALYLLLHFLFLLPFADVLFSNEGMLPSSKINPTYGLFPINILNFYDTPLSVKIFLIVLSISALSLLLGYKRRLTCAILLYGWLALFNRNNLILTPGLGFIGWLLLVMTFIPEGEPYSFQTKNKAEWEMPVIVFAGAWFIMALCYTLSGIDKLSSPSWVDGTAIHKLLYNPLMRDTRIVELFRSQSLTLHKTITYIILLSELLFFPIALFNKTKPIIWALMVFIHLGILLLMNLSDLTIAMLMIHVFTFNMDWLKSRKLIS